jgi:hypothetical protein
MLKITTLLLTGGLLVGVLAASGCGNWGGERYAPNYWHENFKNALRGMIGYNVDKYGGGWADPRTLVNETVLPNGNVAYTFWLNKPHSGCQYTVEVNSETRIVVATSWTGDDCIIVP